MEEVDEIEPSRKLQKLSNITEMTPNSRIRDWTPSSRIIRVSRASGGKDRHSKVLTSKGLRDRRIRLSVSTAIQFYDLQDRLGLDQPSKAVEWLINAASDSISDLPSINPNFSETNHNNNGGFGDFNEIRDFNQNQTLSLSKSGGSSTSETSKTSSAAGLSLSRTEIRGKARERARERTAKEKEKDHQNTIESSFTQLLTGGFHQTGSNGSTQTGLTRQWNGSGSGSGSGTDYFNPVLPHIPQFTISNDQNRQQMNQEFSFVPDLTTPVTDYNTLNFGISSSSCCSSRSAINGGYNSRGTLQSNTTSFLFNNNIHQRSSSSSSSSSSPSFFMAAPSSLEEHSQNLQTGFDGRLFMYGNRSSENKGKERR